MSTLAAEPLAARMLPNEAAAAAIMSEMLTFMAVAIVPRLCSSALDGRINWQDVRAEIEKSLAIWESTHTSARSLLKVQVLELIDKLVFYGGGAKQKRNRVRLLDNHSLQLNYVAYVADITIFSIACPELKLLHNTSPSAFLHVAEAAQQA